MPTVPVLESPTVQAEALPGRPNPRIDDNVSAASFGAPLAQGLEAVGAAGAEQEAKLKTQNDQLRVIDANTQLEAAKTSMLYGQDGKGGAFSLHGTDAMDMPNRILPQYDQVAGKISSTLTADQQRLFRAHIDLGKNELNTSLNRYEYEESNRLADAVYTNGAKQTVTNATVGWRDPQQLAKSREDLQGLVKMQGDREGWSPEQRAAQLSTLQEKMHSSVVDRQLADDQPQAALAYFNKIRDTGELTGEKSRELGLQIHAALKEKQNDQKQDISDRFQDSMTAAEYGLKNPVTVTRAEMEILYPKDAQRHWDALQGIVASGAKSKEYDQMTPEQINADVNSSAPTHGGPEAALAIKAYEIRANAADRSLKARTQDPAQFAMDSGLGWKPLDVSKPDDMLAQLRSRANTQGTVSEQTGVNTPLLSKQESKQFTSWIAAQPPADRVQTLTTLRATMPNDQSYAALMKQIAPGSPLTAIAGSMMDRPQSGAVPNWFNPTYTTPSVVPTRILEGEQILTGKDEKGITSKFPMPTDKDLMPQFMAAVGGSNSDLFRGRPETLESSYAAFKAYYAAEASHQGVTNGIINPTIAQTAARGVIGQATQYGATNLVIPPGMDPTKFEGAVDAASKSALKAGGYSDSDIAILHGGGLRELGDTLGTGRYVIVNGNGDALKSKGLTLDTSKYTLPANDPAANSANWDKRADGSDKGQGFLGLLKRPDGKVSSEISIGVEVNGKEVEVPTMVPTLSQSQLDYLMTHPVGEGHPIPRDIIQKATDYARQRIDAGKSPFAGPNERVGPGKTIVIDLNQSSRIPNALPAEPVAEPGRATTIGDRR